MRIMLVKRLKFGKDRLVIVSVDATSDHARRKWVLV